MKILVIGLDCATPELLLGEERLENIRLMDGGCYGRLEGIVPPITVPAWMCMATSQDRGSGLVEGTHLLDIAPTLLELGGYDAPPAMQGRSLAAGQLVRSEKSDGPPLFDEEEIIRTRLSGLGYIS
jgi:Type I phosphodiesterase / nucleotide pyrophosphatase